MSGKSFVALVLVLHFGALWLHAQPRALNGIVKDVKSGKRHPNAAFLINRSRICANTYHEGYVILPIIPIFAFILKTHVLGFSSQGIDVDFTQTGCAHEPSFSGGDLPLNQPIAMFI